MAHIQWETMSTSFASCSQCLFLDINSDVGLRVVAILTQNEFSNKSVQHVLQFGSIMGSIYDVTIILEIKLGLSSQFTSKVFCRIWNRDKNMYIFYEIKNQSYVRITMMFQIRISCNNYIPLRWKWPIYGAYPVGNYVHKLCKLLPMFVSWH